MTWCDKCGLIIYLIWFQFHFYLSYSMNYTLWAFWIDIMYIIHDLIALEVAQKIQVMSHLEIDDLFIVGSRNSWNKALKNMTWCNRFIIYYLFNMTPISLLSIIFHGLYLMNILVWHLLHCTWLRYIRSCTKDPSHEFLVNIWFVHELKPSI